MAKNFYTGTDADLATGSTNAVTILTPTPLVYGLTAAEVTSYSALATSFNSLWNLSIEPATRTPVVVEQKRVARVLLRKASANLAATVTAVQTVTNAQLLALRMNERLIPTPRPVPEEAPVLEVESVSGRLVKVRVHAHGSDKRGKPFGAIGANIFSYVGPTAPEPRLFHLEGLATRGTVQILFPNETPTGATVWLSACWVSARGQTSIGSVPISFALQGGALPVAA